jgi:hypothetical protein
VERFRAGSRKAGPGWEAGARGKTGVPHMDYVWIRVVNDDWEYTERVQPDA